MASPRPVPFCLVVLSSELKARRRCSSGMPGPVSLNSIRIWVGRRLLRGRRKARVGMVSVPPSGMASTALRVRFRKACASWVRVGHDGRQIGGETADELDLLVAQFVAGQQAEIVEQLVDVDLAQFGFGAAGEIEDLFDDFVQMLHFLPQDGVVFDARVSGREIQAAGNDRAFSSR